MIRPYLSDMINDHKTQEVSKVYSDNKVIDYKTQGEWKIQLLTTINFVSSKDSDEICTMHTKSEKEGSLFLIVLIYQNINLLK